MRRLALAFGVFLLAGVLSAQNAPSQDPARAARLKAAEELLVAMNMEETFQQGVDAMLKVQLDSNPMLLQFEDILREFVAKYVSWTAVKGDYAALYADVFTEQELRDLIAFHQTPLGKKLLASMPDLITRGTQIGQAKLDAHSAELTQKIKARIEEQRKKEAEKKLQGQPGQATPAAPAQPKP
jgi:hypothetical protein